MLTNTCALSREDGGGGDGDGPCLTTEEQLNLSGTFIAMLITSTLCPIIWRTFETLLKHHVEQCKRQVL